jgi:hypothetical protein
MRRVILATTIFFASYHQALADAAGHAALALAVVVGDDSPHLSRYTRLDLALLLEDKPLLHGKHALITVKADSVVCQAGDVDLAAYSCTLTFGTIKRTRTGRRANELFATLIEAGVPSDGAAGHIFESVSKLECKLDPKALAGKDGSGATCTFQPGP